MKLSQLIAYQTALNDMSSCEIEHVANKDLAIITHLIHSQSIQLGNFSQEIEEKHQSIQKAFSEFEGTVDRLKEQIKQQIEINEKPWFTESYRLYEEEMIHETTEYILNRQMAVSHDEKLMQLARLRNYGAWQHPGLILRPGIEDFVQEMVSYDPLYIVDQSYDLLTPAMNRYPPEYQRRLRPYVINERNGAPILDKIPNGQFGLCFAYNYFNFKPFELIKQYLTELYDKMKPGGVLIMTFNDCDNHKAVMLVEQHFCCYTPGKMVIQLAETIGFEKKVSYNDGGPSTWLELKKPGELTSLRGGQTLAKIIHKSVAKSK